MYSYPVHEELPVPGSPDVVCPSQRDFWTNTTGTLARVYRYTKLERTGTAIAFAGMDVELTDRSFNHSQAPSTASVCSSNTSNPYPSQTAANNTTNFAAINRLFPMTTAAPLPPPPPPSATVASKSLDDLVDEFLLASNFPAPSVDSLDVPVGSETALSIPSNIGDISTKTPVKLYPDPLPSELPDMERLSLLGERRAWSDVLHYTHQFLHGTSHYAALYQSLCSTTAVADRQNLLCLETHQKDLVTVLFLHVEALVKLRKYKELVQEIKQWAFCHHQRQHMLSDSALPGASNHTTKSPDWIPWSFHIMAASTLQYGGGGDDDEGDGSPIGHQQKRRCERCLDALWKVRSDLPKLETTARWQVENAIANVFVIMKEWRMALQCLQRMIYMTSDKALLDVNNIYKATDEKVHVIQWLTAAYRCELLSRQGRILLQAGALDQAAIIFQQAVVSWKDHSAATKSKNANELEEDELLWARTQMSAQLAVNDGLVKFSYCHYDQALESFRAAAQHSRCRGRGQQRQKQHNQLISNRNGYNIGICLDLYSEAVNNMALCAMYTCRLPQALILLETLVRENVVANLTDRVTLNLCTLYELASDTAVASCKKRVLQLLARRFNLHDIQPDSFRVS